MLVLAVIAFVERIVQIGRAVLFAVVLDDFIAPGFDAAAICESKAIDGPGQVFFFHQHALKCIRVKAKSGATLELFLVGVEINIFEFLVRKIGWHVGGLGDRGIDPFLCRRLHVDMLSGAYIVGSDEVIR
jgi:hypothetical protein